ncbi:MAG: DNA cytosine methyltransferase [Victivallales bacterium]|nr:DNA cytosine methyltransferase [Victivallales bacterium]
MNYGSVCSGVEAATLAWEHLGWTAKFFAEVEPFPAAVLHYRFNATKPLRSLDPAEAETGKERKERERWHRQIAELPDGGTIPNLEDFTKIKDDDYDGNIDLLVGGTPCQSYSVAGLRKGIEDPRGNLALEFVKLAYRTGSRWIVWENVPGVLSSNKGADFAGFLSLLCGWEVAVPNPRWSKAGIITPAPGCFGLAWRIMDAQYTRVAGFPDAVPQRRRRLFVIGYLGEWLYPAQVLFDGEMRHGDTPPRREKRQGIARDSSGGADASVPGFNGLNFEMFTGESKNVSPTLQRERAKDTLVYPEQPSIMSTGQSNAKICEGRSPALNCNHEAPIVFENHGNDSRIKKVKVSPAITSMAGTGGNNLPLVMNCQSQAASPETDKCKNNARRKDGEPSKSDAANFLGFIKNDAGGDQDGYWEDVFPTIRSQVTPAVAIAENIIGRQPRNGGNGIGTQEELSYTLNCTGVHGVAHNATVRRLLPVECERLMGFPDNHTRIPWRGKSEDECPDAPRYKACGNSMCVNVMAWLGERIDKVENAISKQG